MTPSKLVLVLIPALFAQSLLAQTPEVINYQGRLINGTNLVNAQVGISLRIYTNAAGGALHWWQRRARWPPKRA